MAGNALKLEGSSLRCISDLVKISFKDNNYLASNGRSICTAPSECTEELLCSLHLAQIKHLEHTHLEAPTLKTYHQHAYPNSKFKKEPFQGQAIEPQQNYEDIRAPIKVGQIFYMQFYFTGQCVYYDHHNSRLILSREKRTAFKIIEHISKATPNSKEQQTYDYIGNVVPNQHRYLIVIANQLQYLKFADHSVYLGNYDEKCVVTFSHSIFRMDRPQDAPLLRTPCRLYSVEQEKYVVFDITKNEILLKEESVCIRGMCVIETSQFQINELESPTLPFHRKKSKAVSVDEENKNKIALRVLQGNNMYFMTHQNSSTEKLTLDLNRMLHPIEEKLNTSNTFLMRYEPTFTLYKTENPFNISNISNITLTPNLNLLEEEEKEEIVEELTLRQVNFKNLSYRAKEDITFLIEFYPTYNNQHQIFIYDAMTTKERFRGREIIKEKQLYLDYREVVSACKQQCILKEYNSQKMRRESSKYKNILRVEFIKREMLQPYVHYYSLLLHLKIYNYYKSPSSTINRSSEQRSKRRLNLPEIEEVLMEFYSQMETLAQSSKQKTFWLLRELLEINLIGILEELVQAMIAKKRSEEKEGVYSTIREQDVVEEEYRYETIPAVQTIMKIVLFFARTMSERLILALLTTPHALLFIRLCKFPQIHRFFSETVHICSTDAKDMLAKLENILHYAEQSFPQAKCKNICILWGYRLIKAHQLQNSNMEAMCQKLVEGFKGRLSEDYLIVLELIRLSRGELFYSREVVKFLPFQRLQQEEIPLALRECYLRRIIENYQDVIHLPFALKFTLADSFILSLERDNKRVLLTYLEQVLPKNTKFQSIDNKLFSFQLCQLYLSFNEDLLQQVFVQELGCRQYLPLLITILEEHLSQFIYEEEQQGKYVKQLLNCLHLTIDKYIRMIACEESELGIEDEEMIVRNCLEGFQGIIPKKEAHAATRRSHEHRDTNFTKSTKKTKNTKRGSKMGQERAYRASKKREEGREGVSRATRILNFFKLKRLTHSAQMIECIDKDIIWNQLNEETGKLSREERLDLFERMVNLTTLLLSPSIRFRQTYQGLLVNPLDFSHKFLQVLQLLANKAYQYDLWALVQQLTEEIYSEDEWRIIVAIINKNRLLKHFILFDPARKPSSAQIASLYRVLNRILQHYLQWTKGRIGVDYIKTNQIEDNYLQVECNYHHFSNDLQPDNYLSLLAKVQPTYIKEQLILHLTIVESMGAITNLSFYSFYSQYIIRYECENFHNPIVKLSLAFIDTLSTSLRIDFANNFQYSLFKQSEQLKQLICSVVGIKEEVPQNVPQRANFNILTQLADQRISHLTFTTEHSSKEFLIGLFRLLTQVEINSSTHKEMLPKLTYGVLIGVMARYSSETLLKHEVLGFMLASIEKQMTYGLTKYLKSGEEEAQQPENQEEESEEHALLLDFVKNSNYLFQREIQAFKAIILNQEKEEVFISYANTLLSLVRIRDSIAAYLSFDRNQKVYRSNSGISQHQSLVSKSMASHSHDEDSIPFSPVIREDYQMIARARQLLHHNGGVQMQESEVQNIEGINKLLCYQVLQALDVLSRNQELPASLQKPLQWVENNYKIALSSPSIAAEPPPYKRLLYMLDKSYLAPLNAHQQRDARNTFFENYRNTLQQDTAPTSPTAPKYESINNFLSLRVEEYLVLLIELLQRALVIREQSEKAGSKETTIVWGNDQIIHVLVLIEVELSDQIRLYKLEDEQYGNRDFQVLPEEYYQRSGFAAGEVQEEKYHQRCCQLQRKRVETVFQLLLTAHRLQKPLFLLYIQTILQRIAFYNITNQTALQRAISDHFHSYYELTFSIIHHFRTLSPIVDDSFFAVKELLNPHRICWQNIYKGEDVDEGSWQVSVNALRGMQGYHFASLNYYALVKMLLASSRTLNFQFKSLFSMPTIERESILSELIDVLEMMLRNCTVPTEEKFQFIRVTLKLINTFLRGPIERNVEIAINRDYSCILIQLLAVVNRCSPEARLLRFYVISIKRLIAEGLFILIPFIQLSNDDLRSCEHELRDSYWRSKRAYNGNYESIISDYVEQRESGEEALLQFELALNFYYCLIEIYAQRRNTRITEIQIELLNRQRREKRRRRDWMVFYQLYEIMVAIFQPIYRRLSSTYEGLREGDEEEQLQRAIIFFTRHVSHVEVRVFGNIKKISFLLLQEASCYNVSIRKEFYRLIGNEARQLRLHKFMKVSKYIIIRLEISKAVRRIVSHFKPLEIVLLNRQLWKSLCFLMALLLNVIYVFHDSLTSLDANLFANIKYAIIAFTYMFLLFLYLIYFMEVFPLKLKVYQILSRQGFRFRTLLIFVNDKTLGFAVFYSVFLALAFKMAGFVCVLLFDYFFRFKVSSKITFLMFRSIPKILYVVVLLFCLLYVIALIAIQQHQRLDQCQDVAACTQDIFYIFMELRFNVNLPYSSGSQGILEGLMMLPRLFLKVINISLLVGIIFMEKRKDAQRAEIRELQVRDVCFICGEQRNAVEKARNSNKGFYHHVEMEHNLWNYIYYLVYLKNKERKNLNTIESMIIDQWDNNQIEWLPNRIL